MPRKPGEGVPDALARYTQELADRRAVERRKNLDEFLASLKDDDVLSIHEFAKGIQRRNVDVYEAVRNGIIPTVERRVRIGNEGGQRLVKAVEVKALREWARTTSADIPSLYHFRQMRKQHASAGPTTTNTTKHTTMPTKSSGTEPLMSPHEACKFVGLVDPKGRAPRENFRCHELLRRSGVPEVVGPKHSRGRLYYYEPATLRVFVASAEGAKRVEQVKYDSFKSWKILRAKQQAEERKLRQAEELRLLGDREAAKVAEKEAKRLAKANAITPTPSPGVSVNLPSAMGSMNLEEAIERAMRKVVKTLDGEPVPVKLEDAAFDALRTQFDDLSREVRNLSALNMRLVELWETPEERAARLGIDIAEARRQRSERAREIIEQGGGL